MDSQRADDKGSADPQETKRRLASEVTEVESAIALVASGSASQITLAGLKFGEQVAARFRPEATARGIVLEPILWPEDTGCDLIVRRIDE